MLATYYSPGESSMELLCTFLRQLVLQVFFSYNNDSEKPCTINMIGVASITAPVAAGGKMGYF